MLRIPAFEPEPTPRADLDAVARVPPLWWAFAEWHRGARARAAFEQTLDRLAAAPRGDGHPVFIIPGFLSDARSTGLMRRFLTSLGYEVHDWGMGRNFGPRTAGRTGDRLARHFTATADRCGQKMSLIGWSLGGIMARHLARHAPDRVRRVITLGAPFTGDPRATRASLLYQLLTGQRFDHADFQAMFAESCLPPPVPATSIYSRSDGIVAWQCCVEPQAPHTENIEIDSSHGGLIAHPEALLAIAERLAQPKPFAEALPDYPPINWWAAVAGRFAEWTIGRSR